MNLENPGIAAETHVNLSPEDIEKATNLIFEYRFKFWVKAGTNKPLCQMCLEPLEEEVFHEFRNDNVCRWCLRYGVAPVGPFDSHLTISQQPWIRANRDLQRYTAILKCQVCSEKIPWGERIRLTCCKEFICLGCYCEEIDDFEDTLCFSCPLDCQDNDRLIPLPWAMDYYFLHRPLKPGVILHLENVFKRVENRMEWTRLARTNVEVATEIAKFDSTHWFVCMFHTYLIWAKHNLHVDFICVPGTVSITDPAQLPRKFLETIRM